MPDHFAPMGTRRLRLHRSGGMANRLHCSPIANQVRGWLDARFHFRRGRMFQAGKATEGIGRRHCAPRLTRLRATPRIRDRYCECELAGRNANRQFRMRIANSQCELAIGNANWRSAMPTGNLECQLAIENANRQFAMRMGNWQCESARGIPNWHAKIRQRLCFWRHRRFRIESLIFSDLAQT